MTDQTYDLIVIGGGPAGYVAAIRAAQLGMRVACADRRESLGGTCLNIGCIPSKALLHSSEKFAEARHDLAQHGVKLAKVELDLAAMMARKDEVVAGLTKGIDGLFKKNKVARLVGAARITAPGEVVVNGETARGKNILIATGSESAALPGVAIDEQRVVSSTGALALPQVPKRLVVVGGGYIGLEMGSVWRRLGAEVIVVEFLDRVLPGMDGEVSRQMRRILEKQGFEFRLATKVEAATVGKSGVVLSLAPAAGGKPDELACDVVLVAIGRVPCTDGLGLDALGVARDNRGFIQVDRRFRTNVAGIFAVGDVIPGPMLAHKAMDEGHAAVEMMAGHAAPLNYDAIPGVVYTWPEAASVGRTEEELKAAKIDYRAGKFAMMANSRARTNAAPDGFVKILADATTDRILGAHIVAAEAGTMIAELALAIEFGASSEDVARTCHAHPTLSEAVKEAALAVTGSPVHA